MRMNYSIVIPILNEAETLPELGRRLRALFDELGGSCEAVLVDDGSTDGSFELMAAMNSRDPRFRVIRLSRNFGHQIAITAGLDAATGEAVVVMDGDLQDPPEVVLEMVERWRQGFDVVYAVRKSREGEPVGRRLRAALFYRALRWLSDTEIPVDVGDFRLVDRRVLDAFRSMRETNRYVRGMFSWVGFRQTSVEFVREERREGETKYPLRKLVKLGADGLFGFSDVPLRLALQAGFVISGLSFLIGALAIVAKVGGLYAVPGMASVVVLISFLGGIILLLLGVQGQYIARIHEEVKNRPLYLVQDLRGFERPVAAAPRSIIQLRGIAAGNGASEGAASVTRAGR
jgi:glycosyltransferase involved in cell wall biosynthesis